MRIAVLEDDPTQVDLVTQTLTAAGHTCYAFKEGKTLQKRLRRETFDLLVLDWIVPDMSGEAVLKWVRANQTEHRLPIVFLTCRDDEAGIAQVLNAGADDYVVKPVSGPVLCARIGSLLRRVYPVNVEAAVREFDQFSFDVKLKQAYVGNTPVSLTQKEFELALLLFLHLGRPLSRAHILDLVWKQATDILNRTIDTHISMLRTKLGLRPENGYRLAPIYGYGYRLERVMRRTRSDQQYDAAHDARRARP
ncbi:response regulator transcription factor [Trinickia violacea]|uniref:Response regulator transcription factor n=1 Tax=Trinickia violacea TaxID=2571746 RepID=A0A4P8J2V4_9BURK|nr:response regulator transcription factor [Trinickia violacea]QCP54483.1 response regulator transcription factor [Trinickia violacea]